MSALESSLPAIEYPHHRLLSRGALLTLIGSMLGGSLAGSIVSPLYSSSKGQQHNPPAIPSDASVIARQPTTEEALLEAALVQSGVATRPLRIDCTPGLPIPSVKNPGFNTQGIVRPEAHNPHATPVAHLAKELCDDITKFHALAVRGIPALQVASAQFWLLHEAQHIEQDSHSEALVSCAAFQRLRSFSAALGADMHNQDLTIAYSNLTYWRQPDEYRSPECRPGGALDEGISDDFPSPVR